MSSSWQETPNGEVVTGRVAEYPLVDLASVEHAVSTARVAEEGGRIPFVSYGARSIIRLRPDRHLI